MNGLEIIKNENNINENSNNYNKMGINEKSNNKKGYLKFIGIIVIILIAVSSTTSVELSQYIIVNDFNSPFMITWFNVSFSIFSILIEVILLKIEFIKRGNEIKLSFLNYYKSKFIINENINNENDDSEVSISTAIYQRIRLLKTISVIIFMAGVIGITLGTTLGIQSNTNEDSEIIENQLVSNKVKGYLLMISSACLYGLYEVLVSKILGGDVNRTIVHTYLGFIGFIGMLIGIPVMIFFNYSNFELFKIPSSKSFGIIFSNTVIIFSINYLINWGLSITSSPLFVRAGELMAIPLTLVFDIIIKHMKLPLFAIPGYIFIVIGFILSIYIECIHIKKK
ncbi:hypothetical protein ACTA71_007611 [Dictyostelium dimigraforme]